MFTPKDYKAALPSSFYAKNQGDALCQAELLNGTVYECKSYLVKASYRQRERERVEKTRGETRGRIPGMAAGHRDFR